MWLQYLIYVNKFLYFQLNCLWFSDFVVTFLWYILIMRSNTIMYKCLYWDILWFFIGKNMKEMKQFSFKKLSWHCKPYFQSIISIFGVSIYKTELLIYIFFFNKIIKLAFFYLTNLTYLISCFQYYSIPIQNISISYVSNRF